MDTRYHYDHKPTRRRRRQALPVIAISLLVLGGIGALVWRDIRKNSDNEVSGKSKVILQARDDPAARLVVNEPFFTMDLPEDWKELKRQNDQTENSITWQSTKNPGAGRSLKLYVDTIPTTRSVNRLLPVMSQDNMITVGDISENCATFTQGGTLNVHDAALLKDAPAKWNKVDFICDLARVNDNEVGTGSIGSVNSVTVIGPAKGAHKYFFFYTEHNIQPNYDILYNAIRSFKAK
ncbi:MAG TPA: hypothetical protein VM124_02125 [Candidatus Limnocylindrales bacterium]|nr:hypothetical protein [Candidatus Limnocylindrales bacterium]